MKKQLASFRDFLATGVLGPVSPDMRLIEMAQALGSPDGWNISDGDPIPVYWFFGNLENFLRQHRTPLDELVSDRRGIATRG